MKIVQTVLGVVHVLEPTIFADHRGWFIESYSQQKFFQLGIDAVFVQDNHSFTSRKGTLRGLHFQALPKAQTKLIRCIKGKILDVVVDIREGAPTYKEWDAWELSEENRRMVLVPKGFAHGFVTLTDNVEVQYKVDEHYSSENDRSIRYDDPDISIDWGVKTPILSKKDSNAPMLSESDANFKY